MKTPPETCLRCGARRERHACTALVNGICLACRRELRMEASRQLSNLWEAKKATD